MQRELRELWRGLRRHDDVRCVVLTGAGEKAFCTGIDRMEQMGGDSETTFDDDDAIGSGQTPFMFNDPGDNIGPKSCDLWKPVIAAVNGMACGGAFYMLGEVEFIIASENATFFDPHVTYGMTAAFEPIHMSGIMPFGEIMRLSLMGNHERLSAQRAYDIGMVSEITPAGELLDRTGAVATIIASQPALAIEGTVRAIWGAREMGGRQALKLGYAYIAMGTNPDSIAEGQKIFESGKRIDWKLR
jgi:enoyl-CoA hydratase/carnithine racemase